MQCITVTYSNPVEGRFDFDYYVNRHLPMVRERLGENCSQVEVRRGQVALDGSPAVYRCIATLWIQSIPQLQATLAEHGATIFADIPNYTDIQPVIQIDEILG